MTDESLSELSSHAQWFGSFIIIVLVFSRYSSLAKEIRVVGFLGLVSFICQLLQEFSIRFWGNHYLNEIADFYVYAEILLLLLLYSIVIKHNYLKIFMLVSAVACSVIYVFLFINSNYTWYTILSSTESVLLILCAVAFFFQILNHLPETNILSIPMFWINSANLFYFSCSFILSLSAGYLATVLTEDFNTYWSFYNFLRVGYFILVCVGIWHARKQASRPIKNTD